MRLPDVYVVDDDPVERGGRAGMLPGPRQSQRRDKLRSRLKRSQRENRKRK